MIIRKYYKLTLQALITCLCSVQDAATLHQCQRECLVEEMKIAEVRKSDLRLQYS